MSKRPTPKPEGEYAVGTKTFTIYDDREETIYCAPGTMRCISARVYYPVTKESVERLEKARYMSREMARAVTKNMKFPINYDKEEKRGNNVSECYENAPYIAGCKFPLLLFSHGLGSYREANSYLLTELASQGYVVISIAHPYEAMLVELDNGTNIPMAKGLTKKCYDPVIKSVRAIKKMMKETGTNEELFAKFEAMQKTYNRFLIERIPEWEKDTISILSYAEKKLADIVDLSYGTGVFGHSYGGATAFALCEDHPDMFTCGINMDGGLFGEHEGKITKVPFLQLNCEANATTVTRGFFRHTKPAYHAVMKGMEHVGFSDLKHHIPLKSMVGKLDADVAHNESCRICLEFFDAYLKKVKEKPEFKSDDAVTFTEYAPDM